MKEIADEVRACTLGILHYQEKQKDDRFPMFCYKQYSEEIDRRIAKLSSIRNSIVPHNQSSVAVMAGKTLENEKAPNIL